jgi:hypothetical protein
VRRGGGGEEEERRGVRRAFLLSCLCCARWAMFDGCSAGGTFPLRVAVWIGVWGRCSAREGAWWAWPPESEEAGTDGTLGRVTCRLVR